jgi:hypothetical protein
MSAYATALRRLALLTTFLAFCGLGGSAALAQPTTTTDTTTTTTTDTTTATTTDTTTATVTKPAQTHTVTDTTTASAPARTSITNNVTTANQSSSGVAWWVWVLIGLGAVLLAIAIYMLGHRQGADRAAAQPAGVSPSATGQGDYQSGPSNPGDYPPYQPGGDPRGPRRPPPV